MPKFLLEVSYTTEGAKGLMKEGAAKRRDYVAELIRKAGGTLDAFYFALGEKDAYLIVDLPDHETATSISVVVNSAGAVELKTVVLLSPEQMDRALSKTIDYRPPGK